MFTRHFSVLALLLVGSSFVIACAKEESSSAPGSDEPAANAPDSTEPAKAPAAAAADAGPQVDAGNVTVSDPAPVVCSTLKDLGAVVTFVVEPATPPVAKGGVLVDGTYVLKSGRIFTGPGGDSGDSDQRTLTVRVTGNVLETARVEGAQKNQFSVVGTTLHLTEMCPGAKVTDVGYSATPTTLTIQYDDPDGTFVFFFEKS